MSDGLKRERRTTGARSGPPTLLLLKQAREGREDAFAVLVERYWVRVLLMIDCGISPEVRAGVEPEDIAQDVWFTVYRTMDQFEHRGKGAFFAWLGTIVRHRIVDLIRRNRTKKRSPEAVRNKAGEGAHVPHDVLHMIAAQQTSPSSAVARSESFAQLRAAIRALSARERDVISLRFLQELPVKDTARILEISESAVKMATVRGLEALNRKLPDADAAIA